MSVEVVCGLLIPFVGTTLGAACVFLLRGGVSQTVERALSGFAAGVMVAASIFSLIIPSMDASADMGRFAFVPAFVGFWAGILFLLALDRLDTATLDDLVAAIGLPREKLCTYCWTGKDISGEGACNGGCPGCPHKNA